MLSVGAGYLIRQTVSSCAARPLHRRALPSQRREPPHTVGGKEVVPTTGVIGTTISKINGGASVVVDVAEQEHHSGG